MFLIQPSVFLYMDDPYEEWQGMPEFVQPKKEPFSQLIIRFENEDDMKEFSELINQKITPKTKSIWHPKLIRGKDSHKEYHDES